MFNSFSRLLVCYICTLGSAIASLGIPSLDGSTSLLFLDVAALLGQWEGDTHRRSCMDGDAASNACTGEACLDAAVLSCVYGRDNNNRRKRRNFSFEQN
jgi:hypothetical protein